MLSAALKVGIYSSRVLPAVVSQRKEVELKLMDQPASSYMLQRFDRKHTTKYRN
jgi:hypothetical protein